MAGQYDNADTGNALMEAREKLLEGQPGLRQSYDEFLKQWKHYLKTIEGVPKSGPKKNASTGGFLR